MSTAPAVPAAPNVYRHPLCEWAGLSRCSRGPVLHARETTPSGTAYPVRTLCLEHASTAVVTLSPGSSLAVIRPAAATRPPVAG